MPGDGGWSDDRDHLPLCDWNLYAEERAGNPDLCNLDCVEDPAEVAEAWARVDALRE